VQTGQVPSRPTVPVGTRRVLAAAIAGAGLLGAGCSATTGGSSPPASAVPTATATSPAAPGVAGVSTSWPTYHQNPQRTGLVSGLPAAGPLALDWSRDLDGEVAGQPLAIGDTVVAATEADTVYGLSRSSGAVRWRTSVGTPLPLSQQPCGNLDPLGITSTPVYDQATGLVYVVAQDGRTRHVLAGLRLTDGKVMVSRDIPAPDHQAAFDQQRAALALADGHVYVAFGGHYGDCGPYVGSVVAVPASGRGPVSSYLVPTPKQGGIWAAPGPVVGPSGTIYVSSGNGGRFSPPFDGADSVIALTPQLRRTGVFAPTRWPADNRDDLDLGTTGPALLADGQILQVGKSGIGYLLAAAHLGGVGGQLADKPLCVAFGGTAVQGTTVYVPCLSSVLAVDTAGNQLRVRWRSPAGVAGSPVLGGGALFTAAPGTGVLYEVNPGNGAVAHQLKVAGKLPDFVSPTLSGRLVLLGTLTGVTAVSGA
jgi:outer membrane protein assembly factor BamB